MKAEEIKKPYELPEDQKSIIDLAIGKREPKNAEEAEMLREIKEAEAKGMMLDMPFE